MAASRYRIVLRGRLSENLKSAFDGMTLEHGPNQTVLTGDIRDQAQLYGLIDQLQEFGIDLLAVEPADGPEGGPGPGAVASALHPVHTPNRGPHGADRRSGPAHLDAGRVLTAEEEEQQLTWRPAIRAAGSPRLARTARAVPGMADREVTFVTGAGCPGLCPGSGITWTGKEAPDGEHESAL